MDCIYFKFLSGKWTVICIWSSNWRTIFVSIGNNQIFISKSGFCFPAKISLWCKRSWICQGLQTYPDHCRTSVIHYTQSEGRYSTGGWGGILPCIVHRLLYLDSLKLWVLSSLFRWNFSKMTSFLTPGWHGNPQWPIRNGYQGAINSQGPSVCSPRTWYHVRICIEVFNQLNLL